ncbi:hypothetical protein, partial [Acidisphaera rubrifaciens]|uniref:hypothetical protein n=1 Tax=Acidisphaera rubrifaciens TaxID=50715 RepID=UPI0006627704
MPKPMPPAGAPKGMPPAGAPKGMALAGAAEVAPPGGAMETPPLSYRRLVRWSLIVVGGAWRGFLLAVGLETARKLLMQVNATLLGGIVSALRGAGAATGVGAGVAA